MSFKTVAFVMCECGKRGFDDERSADKALGRAQAKRRRQMVASGTRRGHRMESRHYVCDFGMFHLTGESRKEYQAHATAGMSWDQYLASSGKAA
jgi:hypothetical protein